MTAIHPVGFVSTLLGHYQLSKQRRNLQRLHLRYLVGIALGPRDAQKLSAAYATFTGLGDPFPAEARSLARQHIKQINEMIRRTLDDKSLKVDELTRTHLSDLADQTAKVLDARVSAGDF